MPGDICWRSSRRRLHGVLHVKVSLSLLGSGHGDINLLAVLNFVPVMAVTKLLTKVLCDRGSEAVVGLAQRKETNSVYVGST